VTYRAPLAVMQLWVDVMWPCLVGQEWVQVKWKTLLISLNVHSPGLGTMI
jgi:hypothetical protein